jgi:hypothetical protein
VSHQIHGWWTEMQVRRLRLGSASEAAFMGGLRSECRNVYALAAVGFAATAVWR